MGIFHTKLWPALTDGSTWAAIAAVITAAATLPPTLVYPTIIAGTLGIILRGGGSPPAPGAPA